MGILDMFKKNSIKTPEERRKISNNKIKKMGIACLESLPMIESSSEVHLKDIDLICKKAIATLIATQIAIDATEGKYSISIEHFNKYIYQYDVGNYFNEKEKRLINGEYTEQDLIDIAWEYEIYWSLVWALGLIKDISVPSEICDCNLAIDLVFKCNNYEEFRNKVKLRNIEEILDLLDLHYRYHWATTEKRINPNTPIGNLNPEVVVERRRGLEWLISEESDWYNISLDT